MSETPSLLIRAATRADIPGLHALIGASARALSAGYYTPAQIDAAITYVFGVDSGLVDDGTYFVVESAGELIGCGGWSRRGALYGGDQRPMDAAPILDPATEPARIRAFFVAPGWARRGIGSRLLAVCQAAAEAEGFTSLELMATLPGVPLYRRHGFREVERVTDQVPSGIALEFVRMRR